MLTPQKPSTAWAATRSTKTAVMTLLDIKQRPIEKGLILIASSLEQLRPYLVLDQTIIDRITPTWPGPVTWVIPAQPWVPKWLTGEHRFTGRQSDQPPDSPRLMRPIRQPAGIHQRQPHYPARHQRIEKTAKNLCRFRYFYRSWQSRRAGTGNRYL